MTDLQLSFHTNFGFKKEDILKILRAAAEDQGLSRSVADLMTATGLGNKKVGPMKAWAKRSGLINDQALSEAGKIICEFDPFLQSLETDWFLHFHLIFGAYEPTEPVPAEPQEWGGWTWFIYDYLTKHPVFTIDELIDHASTVFDATQKNLEKNFRYLLNAYTEKGGLLGATYLKKIDKTTYTSENRQLPNPYLIGYCLAQLWQRDFPDTTSILTQDLLNQPLGLAPALSLSPNQLQDTLNTLEYHHILEQRLAVAPFQLIRRWQTPIDLLHKAYTA